MDLTYSKLHPKGQKSKTNEFHEDLSSFFGNNGTLEAFKYLKACKNNAPKMLQRKLLSIIEDSTNKG